MAVAPRSPTGDGFYDSGSSVVRLLGAHLGRHRPHPQRPRISTASTAGAARPSPYPVVDSGNFSTPSITFDRPHQLRLASASQYLVSFRFTDALGLKTVVPTTFQIGTSQPNATLDVQGSKAWIDAGSTLVVKQLLWENADVTPLNQVVSVGAPQNVTVEARVYDAAVRGLRLPADSHLGRVSDHPAGEWHDDRQDDGSGRDDLHDFDSAGTVQRHRLLPGSLAEISADVAAQGQAGRREAPSEPPGLRRARLGGVAVAVS